VQSKLKFALYIISILIIIAIIIGCIYDKRQYKTTIHIQKEQVKEQIHNEKTIETETDREVDIQAVKPVNLGEFKLTAYCSCSICCGKWANNRPNGIVYGAIGEELKEGYSIAVDPNVIPYRTEVIINGRTYKAQDCGGAIKGNRIDVYFEDHDDALEFGIQYSEVFVKM
jgi:3D (Asp-Asp-Asp) domain-containing protein